MRSHLAHGRMVFLEREKEFSEKMAVNAEEYRIEIRIYGNHTVCSVMKGERSIGSASVYGDSWQFHRFCAEVAFRDETGWNYFTAARVFRYFFAVCAVNAEYTEDVIQILRKIWLEE